MKIIVGFIIALLILAVLLTLGILSKYVEDRFKYKKDYELNMEYFLNSIYDDFYEILIDGILTIVYIIIALIFFYILGDVAIGA